MARKYNAARRSGHTILVIDDSQDILESSRQLLEGEGHRVLTAPTGPEGIEIAAAEHPHLILVDYFMPDMTGEEVVRRIRETDRLAQIILVTGYAGEKPARLMMQQLDIQGYHDKGEGADRLLLWVDSSLKAYRSALAAEKHRIGLQYILDITPELHRLQPLDELLQGLLWQVEGLVGAENSFLATYSSPELAKTVATEEELQGFVAILEEGSGRGSMEIRVGTGRFRSGISTESLPEPERALVNAAIESGSISFVSDTSVVPLRLGDKVLGAIYIDRRAGFERDRDLLEIFASQAAAAIRSALLYGQNALLYDLATKDPTTGVCLRGYAADQFQKQLKRSHRKGLPLSVLMIDLDKFKSINDTHGHSAGDSALAAVGELLTRAVREIDLVGRYGGDEFIVILPDTPAEGAATVAERILEQAADLRIRTPSGEAAVRLSVGAACLLPLTGGTQFSLLRHTLVEQAMAVLIDGADGALYAAKGTGRVGEVRCLSWEELTISVAA